MSDPLLGKATFDTKRFPRPKYAGAEDSSAQFSMDELYALYVAAAAYLNRGAKGLSDQGPEMVPALLSAMDKLVKEVC